MKFTCFLRRQSSTASLAMVAPTTTTSGSKMLTARYGANGLKDTQATTKKNKLATRRNCSNRDLGKKLAIVYLVVDTALRGYKGLSSSWISGLLQCTTREYPAPLVFSRSSDPDRRRDHRRRKQPNIFSKSSVRFDCLARERLLYS